MANLSDVKNKPVNILVAALALPKAYPFPEFAEAGHQLNTERHNEGGKIRGSVQIAYDAGGTVGQRAMMIATGNNPEDKWSVCDITIPSVTPAYTALYPAPKVGVGSDLKPNYNNTAGGPWSVASIPFPVVLQSSVTNVGHTINRFEYSGKKRGTVIIVDFTSFLGYAIATGSEPDAPWVVHDGSVLTPTGTPVPPTSVPFGNEQKPVVKQTEYVTSIDFPVVPLADAGDLAYLPLYDEEVALVNLAALNGAQIIIDAGGNDLKLTYGVFTPTQKLWLDLGSDYELTPTLQALIRVRSNYE